MRLEVIVEDAHEAVVSASDPQEHLDGVVVVDSGVVANARQVVGLHAGVVGDELGVVQVVSTYHVPRCFGQFPVAVIHFVESVYRVPAHIISA